MTSQGISIDRQPAWRMGRAIRIAAIAAIAGLLLAAGCARGSQVEADAPRGAEGDPQRAEARGDRERGGPEGESASGPESEGGPEGEESADAASEDKEIRPPGLDLEPQEAREKVEEHLGRAQQALRGDSRDPDRAIDEARKALAVDESNQPAMLVLAWANYLKGYHDMAENVLEIAAERADGKENARYHFIYGLIYESTEREEEAEKAYERAVELEPSYKSALLNVGVYYLEDKRYPEAVRVYEQLTQKLGDDRPESWANLGSAYRGRASEYAGPGGDPERRKHYLRRAQKAYERALKSDGDFAPAYYNLGILYLDAEPFPGEGGELATLDRLRRAKKHFDRYRQMPGADAGRADEQAKVVQDLIAREERREELRKRREERRREEGGE